MANLKAHAVTQISESGNREGFAFSRTNDDQVVRACFNSGRLEFELLRIEDDMSLRFMHVIASIKMTAPFLSEASVFSFKWGFALCYKVRDENAVDDMFEREFFIVSSDRVILRTNEKERRFITQIDDFGSIFCHGSAYFCVDELVLGDPPEYFTTDQIKYAYLKRLDCYKQKTRFRHLSESYKSLAFLSRFDVEVGNDRKLTVVNSRSGKTAKKFGTKLNNSQIKSFEL